MWSVHLSKSLHSDCLLFLSIVLILYSAVLYIFNVDGFQKLTKCKMTIVLLAYASFIRVMINVKTES